MKGKVVALMVGDPMKQVLLTFDTADDANPHADLLNQHCGPTCVSTVRHGLATAMPWTDSAVEQGACGRSRVQE
jgi:hypothetical protein